MQRLASPGEQVSLEGVKMSLYEGEKIGTAKFEKTVHKKNLERLKIGKL